MGASDLARLPLARGLLNWGSMARRGLIASLVLAALLGLAGVVLAGEVEDHGARVAQLSAERTQVAAERQALEVTYQHRTAQIAELKGQPSSWGRDRKLEALLRESKDMASAIDRKQDRVRALDAQLIEEKQALVAAIDRELAAKPGPDAKRRAALRDRRQEVVGRAEARRIHVADESIDPLDDPEDLEYKADALGQSEAQLRAEDGRLERRATYYHRQAKLARAKARSDEQDVLADDQPRHGVHGATPAAAKDGQADSISATGSTGYDSGGSESAVPNDPSVPGAREDTAATDLGGDPVTVLGDVVGTGTLDELRQAEQSGDPDARARAAERARAEVHARAEQIHGRRLEMERRAAELRRAGE